MRSVAEQPVSHPDEAAEPTDARPALTISSVRVCLSETQAQPSLQATQMALKRARLADDLNEKIAQRPGPMELVEKNILAVEPAVKEAAHGRSSDSQTAEPLKTEMLEKKTLLSCSDCV